MNDEFQRIQELLLRSVGMSGYPVRFDEAANRRLASALLALATGRRDAPGGGDLGVLLRHVLRREQERQGGLSPGIAVPNRFPWPTGDGAGRDASRLGWERFGIESLSSTPTQQHVRVLPWMPSWLPGAELIPPDRTAAAEEVRRDYGEPLPGDPFLDPFEQWRTYRTAGQREAIRGLLTAPNGSTLIVNLPTGSGKSLCAYLSSLLDPEGLSVVVVPTTALALDQERALGGHIGHPTAYFGATTAAATERNRGISDRVRAGTQRLVFTSPESLLLSLAGPVYTAAARGFLRLLVIDEAHIVDQWGDDFRPEFQELAGLRRDLLRRIPGPAFKTLLLTGTLTESCLETLETLFGRPGPCGVVSAVQLRPEPSYWIASCADEATRTAQTLEAISHLPRPLILYTTTIDAADNWVLRLQAEGYRRLAAVTGETSTPERAEAIRGWQEGEHDLIVATSAFGLGMDKADVRSIVHACMPEHIDRFYQEVGRSGRDGRASISLFLHTPEDLTTARRVGRKRLITTDAARENKGYERWKAMFFQRKELTNGRSRVRLDVVPEYAFGRFENSSYNVGWNVHTLVLLARAGVIELDAQAPPRREEFEREDGSIDEVSLLREYERHRNERVIRIVEEAHLDLETTWRGTIEQSRSRTRMATERGHELMIEAAEGDRCLAAIFEESYQITPRSDPETRPGVLVSRSCGGCPACRKDARLPFVGGMPTPLPVWAGLHVALPEAVAKLFGQSRRVYLFDKFTPEPQKRERVLRIFASFGFRSFVGPAEELLRLRPLFSTASGAEVFMSEEWDPLHLPRVPTVVYRPHTWMVRRIAASPDQDDGIPLLVWLPADTRDPEKPHCLFSDTVAGPSYILDEFCTRIGV